MICWPPSIFQPSAVRNAQPVSMAAACHPAAVCSCCARRGDRAPSEQACEIMTVHEGAVADERWPVLMLDPRQTPADVMDLDRLTAVLRGETKDQYGEAAVTGTLAIAFKALGSAETIEAAEAQAKLMWEGRDRLRAGAVMAQVLLAHKSWRNTPFDWACSSAIGQTLKEKPSPAKAAITCVRGQEFRLLKTEDTLTSRSLLTWRFYC